MKNKLFIGIILILAGLGAIGYAIHGMQRIKKAKSDINFFTSPFSDKPVGREVHSELHKKASEYDTPVLLLLIGGIVAVIIGCTVTFYCRKKH